MKKASKILYKIGSILDILGIVVFALLAIVFFVFAILSVSGVAAIAEAFEDAAYNSGANAGDAEAAMIVGTYAALICIAYSFVMLVLMAFFIVGLVTVKKASKDDATKKAHIIATVFGFLTNTVAGIGGILSLVSLNQEEKKVEPVKAEETNQVVDVESKPSEEAKGE